MGNRRQHSILGKHELLLRSEGGLIFDADGAKLTADEDREHRTAEDCKSHDDRNGGDRRPPYTSCTLDRKSALGLEKLGRIRTLPDTPSVRGMVAKIPHLVEIVES